MLDDKSYHSSVLSDLTKLLESGEIIEYEFSLIEYMSKEGMIDTSLNCIQDARVVAQALLKSDGLKKFSVTSFKDADGVYIEMHDFSVGLYILDEKPGFVELYFRDIHIEDFRIQDQLDTLIAAITTLLISDEEYLKCFG